jgi:hypothetical protein
VPINEPFQRWELLGSQTNDASAINTAHVMSGIKLDAAAP